MNSNFNSWDKFCNYLWFDKKLNIWLDISKINQSDEKVFSLLSTGETTGLFQLESAGMREAIKQMKPNKFDDIIALVALKNIIGSGGTFIPVSSA